LSLALVGCVAVEQAADKPEPTEPPPAPATKAPTEATDSTAEPISLVDGFGREITLAEPARRVISMAPSNTEILFAIGAGETLVGRDEFSDYPAEALAVDSIGSVYGELNTELIVAMEPDLVFAAGITPPEQIQQLEALGVTVFAVGNPADFDGLFENLMIVGRLVGHEDGAAGLAEELRAEYAELIDTVGGAQLVTLFYEVDGTDPTAPWTTGRGTFQQLIFDLAGGENIAADIEGWGQMNQEEIVDRDPQVIVFAASSFVPTTVDSLKGRAGWEGISAVAEDRVHAVDSDLLDLPGPRLIEGLRTLAGLLHPELFAP
jgi:iron complex transport system substrate-binding protein